MCFKGSQNVFILMPQLTREILAWTWIGEAERLVKLAA